MALGGITLEKFKGVTELPQKAASAWAAVDGGIVGVGYKCLLYCGTQVAKGTNHWFIAEQTTFYSTPIRRIVKLAVNEFDGKFQLIPQSIENILG